MFSKDYLEKLKEYLGRDIHISDEENEVRIYADEEIQYFLRKREQEYVLYMQERANITKEKEYKSETELSREFALWMKNIFSENIKYPFSCKFEDVKNETELENLMCRHTDNRWYSINSLQKEKINLEQKEDGLYCIFFLDRKGNKYVLEQGEESPFVFKRFYNEVVYYGETLEQIQEYERIFKDKLDCSEKIKLLGY